MVLKNQGILVYLGGSEVADRQSQIRLQTYMADVMELENDAQKRLRTWGTSVSVHPEVRTIVDRLRTLVYGQTETWRARMQAVGGKFASPEPKNSALRIRVPAHRGANTISAALHEITTTCAHLSFAYAKVHAVAHRFFDRTTADLAEKHMRAYAGVVRDINRLISDVVVWELMRRGQECQCQCPSCGLGVCVCAPHGTLTVEEVWGQPLSISLPGMLVRPPRANSPAAQSGLRAGDVVTAVDDQEIRSVDDMQLAIRKHNPGDQFRLRVRREPNEIFEVSVTRPQPPS